MDGRVKLDTIASRKHDCFRETGALRKRPGSGAEFDLRNGEAFAHVDRRGMVAESEAQVDEATTRLARIGMENVKGYLSGGILAWAASEFPVASVPQITVDELRALVARWLCFRPTIPT